MLNRAHPVVLRFGNAARARYGRITPFRLGYVAGENTALTGEFFECPYDDQRGRMHFKVGIESGSESVRRIAQRQREEAKDHHHKE